ncbi:hypothetical protein SGRIM119S_02510 [Streptomyces griseorubiginosus]
MGGRCDRPAMSANSIQTARSPCAVGRCGRRVCGGRRSGSSRTLPVGAWSFVMEVPGVVWTRRRLEFRLTRGSSSPSGRRMLLCLSSCRSEVGLSDSFRWRGGQSAIDLAGDESLEAAHDGLSVEPFFGAAFDVAAGAFVEAQADQDDGVQGVVRRPVAAAVEPLAVCAPGGGRDRGDPGQVRDAASERMRSGLSPADVGSCPAVSGPTPNSFSSAGVACFTSGSISQSNWAISSSNTS